jgi:hypothetical protein
MHVFMLMLMQLIQLLSLVQSIGRLPSCFTREFGLSISEYVVLRDPNNNEFEVHVSTRSNETCFDDGWSVLKDVYHIPFGAWVTFTYVTPSLFTIRVNSRWGAEVTYPNNDPPIRRLLARNVGKNGVCSSSLVVSSNVIGRPTPPICSYTKKLTFYDIHSGTLVLFFEFRIYRPIFHVNEMFSLSYHIF